MHVFNKYFMLAQYFETVDVFWDMPYIKHSLKRCPLQFANKLLVQNRTSPKFRKDMTRTVTVQKGQFLMNSTVYILSLIHI